MSKSPVKNRAEEQLLPAVRIACFLLALLTAGCAALKHVPAAEVPASGAAPAAAVVPEPAAAPVTAIGEPRIIAVTPHAAAAAQEPAHPGATRGASVEHEPKAPVSAPRLPGQPAAKAESPAAMTPQKAAAPAAQVSKKEGAAPGMVKPDTSPPLDLKSLETRLKDTKAIGVLTKLTLKNQVDDLLNRFRAYYQGRLKTTLAELRRPYDMLLLKVLALLQDTDPPLASAIVASREAIWGILADPAKFAGI